MTVARPPYDPELKLVLDALASQGLPSTVTADMIEQLRVLTVSPPIEQLLVDRRIVHAERTIPGPPGAPDLVVSVFSKTDHQAGGPGLYVTHGGGMIMGNRFNGILPVLDWVQELDAVAVSVEYRLAPEHPDPAPVQDCYAGLVWTAAHAEELGFDASRLVITGGSAGGGLAAGAALLARDRGGPALAGQLLIYPMLDDRNQTVSSHQYIGIGVWDRISNDTGWDALLGERRHTEQVSIYAAPARALDLSGLPPTYIDVGSAEVFRDEDVAYASTIWACGGQAELHVWPGAFHGADVVAPKAAISIQSSQTRIAWLRRVLSA